MYKKVVLLCAAVVGFGLAIERPSSEVFARRRCCNNGGYYGGCGGCGYHNHGCCGRRHRCGCGVNYGGCGGCGYNGGYAYQGCGCQQQFAAPACGGCQSGCQGGSCPIQQNSCQGGCSVNSAGIYSAPINYGASYGPTPQGDFYRTPTEAAPPTPVPERSTFEQDTRPATPAPAPAPAVETRPATPQPSA